MVPTNRKHIAAAEIPFGQLRQKALRFLGEPSATRTYPDGQTDFYPTFKVHYNTELACVAAEFGESIFIDDIDLLALNWGEIKHWFLERDPQAEIKDSSIKSKPLRMGATTWQSIDSSDDQKTETVMLVSEDYHWPTEDEIEAEILRIDAEMAQMEQTFEFVDYSEVLD